MPAHPLTNFEIQKYYQNEPRFNDVFSRNNLPEKIKDGAYVINLDEYADVGTHWIALFCNRNEIVYFDSFHVEHAPKEIKKFVGNKDIKENIFRVQANNSVMCGYFCIGFIDLMLAGRKVTDFTNIFSPYDFKKNDDIILSYLKMNEIDKAKLTDQTKFRQEKITEIQNYFHQEIIQRKLCGKKLNKYLAAFDYKDKILIVLSAASGGVCIISSASVVGAPIGIVVASFTLIFSLTTGIIKKLVNITRNKKKKHNKILMLAKSKLNSIETLISQALIDTEINHEKFITILREKVKYKKMKENVKNKSERQENTRLNSVNSRNNHSTTHA